MASLDGDDAIAVVGMACKVPGADSLEEFWRLLENGENHIKPIPPDRFDLAAYYDTDPDAPGKTYMDKAGFVDRPHAFDNKLFQISDDEARKIDPQQKWLLECTYKALENAGIPLEKVRGSHTAVYIGAMVSDYNKVLSEDDEEIDAYDVTASEQSLLSAKVSHIYDLRGPSMTVSTGCSSSMTCVHLGVQALRNGECDVAICGGVNVILTPANFIVLAKAGMGSRIGQCQAFSDSADGYARAEGCAVVVLKKVSQARTDKDNIWGTVGTGINQDGKTEIPITAPSSSQQADLIQKVHATYKTKAEEISYFEAHGTGTPKGDPIEASAIGKTIGKARKNHHLSPCLIGSVKTNLGHTEAAAGVVSLVKVLLMMKHKKVPPTLFTDSLNKKIDFETLHLEVVTHCKILSVTGEAAVVGINSFGYGGSNAYAIVKEFKICTDDSKKVSPRNKDIIVFSAPETDQLEKCVKQLQKLWSHESNKYTTLSEISYTSAIKRTHFKHRKALLVSDLDDLAHQMKTLHLSETSKKDKIKTILVFPGMGTHWSGMCKELINSEPVVRVTLENIDRMLQKYVSWSILKIIEESQEISDPAIVQPVVFAIQVALLHLWKHWGIAPDGVVGHSFGEVAAAYAAGHLSLEDAIQVAYHRGRLLSKVSGGKMLAVGGCDVNQLESEIKEYGEAVTVSAYNSKTSCALSGDAQSIANLKDKLHQHSPDIFLRELEVTAAYHSPHVDPILRELEANLKELRPQVPHCKIVSTVTGKAPKATEYSSGSYWCSNVRQPVLFAKALEHLLFDLEIGESHTILVIETGPRAPLRSYIEEIGNQFPTKLKHLACMEKQKECIQLALCEVYETGLQVNWQAYHETNQAANVPFVHLPLRRNEFYFEPERWNLRKGGVISTGKEHCFVSPGDSHGFKFNVDINEKTTPFVFDHWVSNQIVPPGSLYAEVAIACMMMKPGARWCLTDLCFSVFFQQRIEIQHGDKKRLEATVSKSKERYIIKIKDGKHVCSHASVEIFPLKKCLPPVNVSEIKARCPVKVDGKELYENLRKAQFSYGETLTVVKQCYSNQSECIADLKIPEGILQQYKQTHMHPVVFDGLMHCVANLGFEKLLIPTSVECFRILGFLERDMIVHLYVLGEDESGCTLNGCICDMFGRIVAAFSKIRLSSTAYEASLRHLSYKIAWTDETLEFFSTCELRPNGKYLIIGNDMKHAKKLEKQMKERSTTISSIEVVAAEKTNEEFVGQIQDFSALQAEKGVIIYLLTVPFNKNARVDDVVQTMYERCALITEVMKILQAGAENIVFYIVTVNAQNVIDEKENTEDLLGHAVWGYARSIMSETHIPVTLFDLQNVDSLDKLVSFVERYIPSRPEWTLQNESLMSNQVVRALVDGEGTSGKENSLDEFCKVFVASNRTEELSNLHLHYQEEATEEFTENEVLITLKECVLPNKTWGQMITMSQLNIDLALLDETCSVGHPIMILDSLGQIPSSEGETRQVAILYPIPCQTAVSVPTQCIVDTSDIPLSSKLLLSHVYITYQIALIAKEGNHDKMFIYKNKGIAEETHVQDTISIVLEYIFGSKIVSISSISEMKFFLEQTKNPILLLLNKPTEIEKELSVTYRKRIQVLVLEELVNCLIIRKIQQLGYSVIRIQMQSLLSPFILQQKSPEFYKWLQTCHDFPNLIPPLEIIQMDPHPEIKSETKTGSSEDQQKLSSVMASRNQLFRKNATYIFVGGTKSLGWVWVKHMALNNAGVIVCVSRSQPSDERANEIKCLEKETQAKIISIQCDITDYKSTEKMLYKIRRDYSKHPIKGIFHGASVYVDQLSSKMTREDFAAVVKPKVCGAWNLHVLTQNDKLDYFVLLSSIASVLGNSGQAHYAAANQFLNGLAVFRRHMGLAGQSIGFGTLKFGESGRTKFNRDLLTSQGWILMEEEQLIQCMEDALLTNRAHCIYFDANFEELGAHFDIQRCENGGYVKDDLQLGPRIAEKMKDILLPYARMNADKGFQIGTDTSAENKERIVANLMASVIGVEVSEIQPETPLNDIGITSVHATLIRNKLRRDLKINISIEHLLQPNATVRKIVNNYT